MVAAGVYLTARIFVLLTPDAQLFVAIIGCITLTLAALVAIVQTDIKRVLAYSTISQLGYMMLGMGVGAWIAACSICSRTPSSRLSCSSAPARSSRAAITSRTCARWAGSSARCR